MAQKFTTASIQNNVTVEKNAQLHWMPQETILFENSNLSRSLIIDMHETSKCLLVEPLVFGRIASGERLKSAKIRDHIEIRKNGSIHFLDKLFLSNNVTEHLRSATIANGAHAIALVVYIGSDAGKLLSVVRSLLPETAGASLVQKDTLVLRALASNSYELRQFLIPVLKGLSGNLLPKPWMI
jgi:urease accessory protein